MITPIIIVVAYVIFSTTLCVYMMDHIEWKPYFTKGSKAYIGKLPHWF